MMSAAHFFFFFTILVHAIRFDAVFVFVSFDTAVATFAKLQRYLFRMKWNWSSDWIVLYRCAYNNNNSFMYRLSGRATVTSTREQGTRVLNWIEMKKRVQVNEQTNRSSFNEFMQPIPYRRTAAREYQCIADVNSGSAQVPDTRTYPFYSFVSASFSFRCWLCFCYLNAAQIQIKLLAHWVSASCMVQNVLYVIFFFFSNTSSSSLAHFIVVRIASSNGL